MTTKELVSKYKHIFNTDYTADANCQGAWLFAEGSGTTVADDSQNTNTGNFASAGHPAWSATVPTYGEGGSPAGSADFEIDDSDKISVGTNSSLNITGTAFTALGWIKPETVNYIQYQPRPLIDRGTFPGSGTRAGYQFGIYEGDDLRLTIGIGYNSSNHCTSLNQFSAGNWYHIAGILNGAGAATLYVNGVEVASYSNQPSGMSINTYAGEGFLGTFDGLQTESAVFSDSLSSTEINEIMDYGLKPTGVATGYMTCGKYWG